MAFIGSIIGAMIIAVMCAFAVDCYKYYMKKRKK